MSEEAKQETAPVAGGTMDKSIRSVVIFSSVVLWLLAIFMINIMNGINTKLQDLNQNVGSLTNVVGSQKSLDVYQIINPAGEVVYDIQVDPKTFEEADEAMEGEMSIPQE